MKKIKVCPKCNILLTKKNTFIRKNGCLCGYCKECDKVRLYEFNHRGDSEIKILNEIDKLNKRKSILIKILMNK